jgi:glycosyltransferase involved in cell wall biosynthesis
MRLSILMPSHRDDLAAISRIAQACSWAGPEVEVIVRDNSQKPGKRSLIERFEADNFRLVFAEECEGHDNAMQALALARGDFVFFVADDDTCLDRGIAAIAAAAAAFSDDASVCGITGAYVVEEQKGSIFIRYPDVASPDVVARTFGYVGVQGPNLLFYSALRRTMIQDCWRFIEDRPFAFPFHDQVLSLLHLLAGRFVDIGRLMVAYDNLNWESAEKGANSDTAHYAAAGMDPAFGRLSWLLCAFEGAWLTLYSRYGSRHTIEQRQAIAVRWFEVMFARFAGDKRGDFGSSLGPQADLLCQKWRGLYPHVDLQALLADICDFIALSSPENARLYGQFWRSLAAESISEPGS